MSVPDEALAPAFEQRARHPLAAQHVRFVIGERRVVEAFVVVAVITEGHAGVDPAAQDGGPLIALAVDVQPTLVDEANRGHARDAQRCEKPAVDIGQVIGRRARQDARQVVERDGNRAGRGGRRLHAGRNTDRRGEEQQKRLTGPRGPSQHSNRMTSVRVMMNVLSVLKSRTRTAGLAGVIIVAS